MLHIYTSRLKSVIVLVSWNFTILVAAYWSVLCRHRRGDYKGQLLPTILAYFRVLSWRDELFLYRHSLVEITVLLWLGLFLWLGVVWSACALGDIVALHALIGLLDYLLVLLGLLDLLLSFFLRWMRWLDISVGLKPVLLIVCCTKSISLLRSVQWHVCCWITEIRNFI